jgi:ApaG protein
MDQSPYHIVVEVEPEYAEEHSEPEDGHFVFIYHVTIRNAGSMAAQLMSRRWLITDANGDCEEVEGEGVIGEQPVILPGAVHRYNSFCVLPTEVGCMEGHYSMVAEDGTPFQAPVPMFTLAVPTALN